MSRYASSAAQESNAPSAAETYALEISRLTVAYQQRPAISDISFCVRPGARVAVVGPNGAGKSTLLKAIGGLIRPTSGTIRAAGHLHTQCAAVAYVPQRAEVDWSFPVSVWDVVMMGRVGRIGLFRWPGKHDREQVQQSLELVRMASLSTRQIGELSGGQQQRVFIARALAQQASILLLDEPLTGLDVRSQDEVLTIIADVHQRGVTVLVATHDLGQAADSRHYEQVLLINRRLIGLGRAHEVLTAEHLMSAYGTHLHRIETDQGVLLLHDQH